MITLQPGDIIFNTDFMHCYICIKPCVLDNINRERCAAHASPAQNESAVLQSTLPGNQYFVFRSKDATLAMAAAKIAMRYTAEDPHIPYNHGQLTKKNNACYAATTLGDLFLKGNQTIQSGLIALFKRLERLDHPSAFGQTSHGFTCAQLVILSYQLATAQLPRCKPINEHLDAYVSALPNAMRTHEAWTRAEQLAERLEDDQQHFAIHFVYKNKGNEHWESKAVVALDDPQQILKAQSSGMTRTLAEV